MTCQNFRRTSFVIALSCLLAVAAAAQTPVISVSSSNLNITVPSGGTATQQINLNTTVSTTVFISTTNSPSWLSVSPFESQNVFAGTPVVLTVTANASGLTPGPYAGTFTISLQNIPNPQTITVTVNLTVAGTSLLTSNQASLTFDFPAGTPESSVPTQLLQISSSAEALNFNVTASTQNGGNWLIPFTTSGSTNQQPSVTVGVNPAGLPAGMYSGTILVQSTTTSDSVSVPVTMIITAPQSLSLTPDSNVTFLYQLNTVAQTNQLTRNLMLSSTNTQTPYSSAENPVVSWLVVSPSSGATGAGGAPVTVTLTANPNGLSPGMYTTQLTFGVVGGTSLAPITVTLIVSSNPLLQLSSNSLTFASNFGATAPPTAQTVNVTTLGAGNTSFTFSSNQSWLSVTGTSNFTPSVLTVSANPSGLAVGTYSGIITVIPNNSDANLYSLQIMVTFTIGSSSQVTAGPALLVFSYEPGAASNSVTQLVELQATGQPVTFGIATSTTTASNCPGNWLSATTSSGSVSSTQPATISVSVAYSGLTAGTCSGNVVVTYPAIGANPSTITIPVMVEISNGSELTINEPLGFGIFTSVQGGSDQTSTITIGTTDGTTQPFSVNATSNGPSSWLFVGVNGTTLPQQLQVQIVPGNLPANTYGGTITISSPNLPSSPVTIPVTLTITSNVTVTISGSGTLNFSQSQGGTAPATQNLTISSSASGASFLASVPSTAACSWLTVSPTSGTASGTISFIPKTNSLAPNTYTCPVVFSFIGSSTAPITETAVLTVGSAQTIAASAPSLAFAFQIGGATPATQQLMVSSTGGAVNFTVGVNSTGGWLSTSAGSIALPTPQTLTVAVNPANFPAGTAAGTTVQGSITITAPGVSGSPITVPVSVTISPASTPQPVTIVSSATFALGNGIAPGELITIKGLNLGPASPAAGTSFTVTSQNTVSSTLAGVQVTFGGIAGTPTYVSPTQINVVVPWEIAGRTSAAVVVIVNNVPSASFDENVVSVSPGIYTLNATGVGQAAALNQSLTINGPTSGVTTAAGTIPTTPAAGGTVIAVYGTGGGLTSPQGVTGTLTPTTQLYPLLNWTLGASNVTATIGGKAAVVEFVGAAPGEITGVLQINLLVPTGLTPGNQALVVTIDGVETQANVTVTTM